MDLIPVNLDLATAEIDLNAQYAREYALLRLLAPIRDAYDAILIDCQPQLGILTINALVAADGVLVLATNYLSLRRLQLLLRTVRLVQSRLNASLRIEGLLPTRYDRRTSHHQEALQEVRRVFGPQNIRVFDTVIPRSVRFEESPILRTSGAIRRVCCGELHLGACYPMGDHCVCWWFSVGLYGGIAVPVILPEP